MSIQQGALEVIEELVEMDENGIIVLKSSLHQQFFNCFLQFLDIGTINIEEMVLENYGQDYEELDVDVEGIEEDVLEDIEDDLLDELEENESDEEDDEDEAKVEIHPPRVLAAT